MFIRRVQKLFVFPQWLVLLGLVVLLAVGLLLRAGSTYANANQTIGGAPAWLNAAAVLPDFPANNPDSATFTLTVTDGVACDSTPGFTGMPSVAVGTGPAVLTVGDFNNDGNQDLAVPNLGSNPGAVSIRLGDGDGTFSSAADVATGYLGVRSAAVGDFDGDDSQDLAVVNRANDRVTIHLGNGDGTFATPTNFTVGDYPTLVRVGDFDNDARQDLAILNAFPDTVSIRLGNGDGTFTSAADVNVVDNPYGLVVGDLNNDGDQDLVIGSNTAGGGVSIRLGNGDGTFTAMPDLSWSGIPQGIALGDFNNDGDQDVFIGGETNSVSIRLGDGDGTFDGSSPIVVSVTGQGWSPVVVDFNNDGNQDFAVTNSSLNSVSIRLGDGAGGFSAIADVSSGGTTAYAIIEGDFNNDGKLDFAVSNHDSDNVGISLGNLPLCYDGNGNDGGSAPVDSSSPYAPGATVTVLGNTGSLVKTGYTFNGWNTAADGSGTSYAPAATFNITTPTILYAQWVNSCSVTNNADSGAGSLRQAVLDAAPGDTICFDASLSGQTITLASTLIITESLTIDGSGLANQVTISGGGTVRVFDISTAGNTVILNNLTIANGAFAGNCGGINNNGSTLTVSGCNFNNNNASAGNGGAIYNNTDGLLTVSECNFNGNSAASQGGAIYTYQGTVDINSSSFYSNTSVNDGSVLFSFFGSGITVTIANSSFYSNSVTGYNQQAAVYVRTNLVIKNSTFSGNRAVNRVVDISDFANCTPACTIQLGNNIFADVAAGTGHVASGGGTYIDLGHNMVDTNESAIFSSSSSQLNTDPLLDSWANNGGSTPTFALLTGSPAIDAGDDAMCAAPPVNGRDQRGVTRPQGAHCDIGAYELEQASSSYALTIATAGGGSGVVTPTVGAHSYPSGTVVTLEATPASGSTFDGWSGDTDCADGSVTMDADKTCTATFTSANHPPQIFGTPNTQAIVGEAYAFTPGATDADGDPMTFAIQNRPTWASFYTATGVLSGTPTIGDVGETTGIIISVNDGQVQASLPAFTLGVVQPQNFNHPPAFRIRQAPATALVGQRWCFDPQAYDPDADVITVAVQNRPAWITEFNAQTGRMCGTPAAAHVGASGAIQLTVTDPSAASDSLTFSVQVNSPTFPCQPTALEFSAAIGDGFAKQSIACPNMTLAEAQGMFNSRVLDFTADVTLAYNSSSVLLNIQPSSAGLAIGTYNRSIRFTLRGVEYTVPVKLIVTSPPPSILVLSQTDVVFSYRLGENAGALLEHVDVRSSTNVTLTWTATANVRWAMRMRGSNFPPKGTATKTSGYLNLGVDSQGIHETGTYKAQVVITDQNNKRYPINITLKVDPPPSEPGGNDSGDVQLIALEVTQGLQNWNHEIPLLQNRTTWVRAHVRNLTYLPIQNVMATLEVWRGGVKLGTLAPDPAFVKPGGLTLPSKNYDPLVSFGAGTLDPEVAKRIQTGIYSFDFRLDPAWLNGDLTFKLVGKSQAIVCDEQDTTKDCAYTVSFESQARPALKLRILGSNPAECANLTRYLDTIVPLKFDSICDLNKFDFFNGPLQVPSWGWIHARYGEPKATYFGVFATRDSGVAGWSDYHDASMARPIEGITAAHEIGHAFGLRHNNLTLSTVTTGVQAYYGFYVGDFGSSDRAITDPKYNMGGIIPFQSDLMSTGGGWPGPSTYNYLLNRAPLPSQVSSLEAPAALTTAGSPVTFISGEITDTYAASLKLLSGTEAKDPVNAPTPGDYGLRLLDGSGTLVYSVTFQAAEVTPVQAAEPEYPDLLPHFDVPVPYALDENTTIRQVVLVYQDTVLDTVSASDAAPAIAAWSIAHGSDAITATVTVSSNQSLTYRLAYSHAPDEWQEVSYGTATPQDGSATFDIVVDKALLPGTGVSDTQAWQLWVSDGFYTVHAEQADSFSIPNKRPVAWIFSPYDGNALVGDQTLYLEGIGYDLEDGWLSGSQLVWHSDRDGILGYGATLTVTADALSAGLHILSLEAIDSNGDSSVIVFKDGSAILPVPQVNADASTSDGLNSVILLQVYRDRPYAPSILHVDDLSLSVPAGLVSTTTIPVLDIGDDGSLPWTLQTTPPTWLSFDQTSGTTPSVLTTTVNATALMAGMTYTGTLTFQAGAPATQTVTMTYSIDVYTPSTVSIYLPLVLRNTP